jgi:hypothetical protein
VNQSPAELRNAAARQLIARGRFRQALDVLNEAIRLEPRHAESYKNRAEVFEALKMAPQAEADRRKFLQLGGVMGGGPADESEVPPKRVKVRRPPPAAIGIRYPESKRPRGGGLGNLSQSALTLLAVLALLSAAGLGIFLAISLIDRGGDESLGVPGGVPLPTATESASGEPTAQPTEPAGGTATGTGTPAPSASLVPTPESLADALNGSPLSFSSLQTAWAGKGITAEATEVNQGVTGTGTTPVSVTLSRGGEAMHVAALFYDDGSGPGNDFNLGDTVSPKEGKSIPSGAIGWWNSNVVIIVLDQVESIKNDARDAFLG